MEVKTNVRFADAKLRDEFIKLGEGREQEKKLKEWLEGAFAKIEKDAFCGVQIPKRLIPKEYKKYNVDNLWKINLPEAWRLIYTIKRDEVVILGIILEWVDHKEYEKRFKY